MIILDTDAWSIQQRRSGRAFERLAMRLLRSESEPVSITIVSIEEQMRGWLAYMAQARDMSPQSRAYERLKDWVERAAGSPILPFGERAAEAFERLRKNRVRIGTMGLRIAAIAITRDAVLVSRNLRDFQQVPGLRVEDWTR